MSDDTAVRDPLEMLRILHTRCQRYGNGPRGNAQTVAVLSTAIAEITRLRQRLEACEQKHRVLEQLVMGGRWLPR
jgi:hypothetical protein